MQDACAIRKVPTWARASCRQDALPTRAPGRGEAALARDLPWKLVGVDDLGGDGRADILLRHDDGHWHYCGMSGRRVVEQGPSALPRNPVWTTGASPDDLDVPKTFDDG